MSDPNDGNYVSLADAKDHLGVDEGLQIHDRRISLCIGGAEDWAENYTNRSLGELMLLDSPADDKQVPLPNPVDPIANWPSQYPRPLYLDSPVSDWMPENFRHYWAHCQPTISARDDSKPLRRDIYSALLLYMETLFDRNTDNFAILQLRATQMLDPYRIGQGV